MHYCDMIDKINNSKYNISTKYWHKLDNGKIQCDVCPRTCKLNEGQRGLCFVRARLND